LYCWPTTCSLLLLLAPLLLTPTPKRPLLPPTLLLLLLLLLLLPAPASTIPPTRHIPSSRRCSNCCFRQPRKLPDLSLPQGFKLLTKP
jgi:hypothetical protein